MMQTVQTKDKEDKDHLTWTKAKAEAIAKYIDIENKKGKKLFGGIVVNKDKDFSSDGWRLNDKVKFDLYKEGDWAKV